MIIKCSSCGSRYRVSDDLVADGPKKFKCKNCGAVLLVKPPAAAPEKPAVKPAPKPEPPAQKQAAPQAEQPEESTPPPDEEAPGAAAAGDGSGWDEPEDSGEEAAGEDTGQEQDNGGLSPEELAAQQQQDIQEKLEKRRQQMEDEISGRLNKAALETLDFDVLTELAQKIQGIQHNPDFHMDPETKLFSCIKCKTTYCIYPEDARTCANCTGEVALVRGDDILKQYGMFG